MTSSTCHQHYNSHQKVDKFIQLDDVTTKLYLWFTWETTLAKKDSRYVHITESVEVHDKKVFLSIEVM